MEFGQADERSINQAILRNIHEIIVSGMLNDSEAVRLSICQERGGINGNPKALKSEQLVQTRINLPEDIPIQSVRILFVSRSGVTCIMSNNLRALVWPMEV